MVEARVRMKADYIWYAVVERVEVRVRMKVGFRGFVKIHCWT